MTIPATTPAPRRAQRLALALGLLAVVFLLPMAWYLWVNVFRPPAFNGLELQSARPAPDFALTNADGQAVRLSDLKGKLVVLYFGYTFCPDVCPMTLAK